MDIRNIDLRQAFPALPVPQSEVSFTAYLRKNDEFLGEGHRFPAVIVCPGGGYARCSVREAEPVALRFVSEGYNCFVLNYPVAPDRYPSSLLYLSAAVAWVRRNADELNVDPERVAVCGFSAAGHLCATLSAFWQEEFIARQLGLAPEENRPDASILCYPVITFGEFAHAGSRNNLLGEEPDPTLVEKLSIENSVTPLFPPTFLWNTYTDGVVPAENSLLLAASLRRAGVSVEFHMYHQGPHGLSMCDHTTATNENSVNPHCASWFPLCCEWLSRVFAK